MALDGLVLNGTNLNDETNYGLEALDIPPAPKLPEFAEAVDADGQDLIRTPRYGNRVITITFRVGKQASKKVALEKIGALTDLFQEAEKNPEGVPLEYTPANATQKFTFFVLTGQITEIPMVNEGTAAGFYVEMPQVKAVLTCRPFGYGEEEEVLAAKSIETGLSIVIGTIASVKGDVPAEGRIVVKDTAKVGRRFVEWGLENRYYNAATNLVEAPENTTPTLVAVGGSLSELTGAYKAGAGTKTTIATTLVGEPTVCCETGVLKHIGPFRVKARAQVVLGAESLAEKVHVRLSWQDGEGAFRANPWQTVQLGGKFVELDLGPISPTPAITGSQKWVGRVEAYSTNAALKDVFHVNYLAYVPTEGYGKASGPTINGGGSIAVYDNFTTGTLSGSLSTRTPAIGAAWVTSGATTDFTVEATRAKRTATSDAEPRFAVVGSELTNCWASMVGAWATSGGVGEPVFQLIARWTNSSNYAFLRGTMHASSPYVLTQIGVVVAGATTILGERFTIYNESSGGEMTFTGELISLADGTLTASGFYTRFGAHFAAFTIAGSHSSLVTGGALAKGKVGISDRNPTSSARTRYLSLTSAAQLPAIPYVIQSERRCQFRSESTITEDSTGTYNGPVQVARGGRFFLPQAGSAARTTRLLVKADRNDLEEADQQTIGDTFTIQGFATPRYAGLPR